MWTHSGTASGSVWNGAIRFRVNMRPIRTFFGTVPIGTVSVQPGLYDACNFSPKHWGRRLVTSS